MVSSTSWKKRSQLRLDMGETISIRRGAETDLLFLTTPFLLYLIVRLILEGGNNSAVYLLVFAVGASLWLRRRIVLEFGTNELTVRNLFKTYSVELPADDIIVFDAETCYIRVGESKVRVAAVNGHHPMGIPLGPLDPRLRFREVRDLIEEVCPTCVSGLER